MKSVSAPSDTGPKPVQLDASSMDRRFHMGMLFTFVVITSPIGLISSTITTGMAATGKASWLLPLALITVGLVLPGLLLTMAMRGIRRTQVRVGNDGISLDAKYRKSHFIRYERLRRASVQSNDKTLRLELKDGSSLDVPVADESLANTVVEQIEVARSKPRHDVRADELHALDRGDHTWDAWQQRLKSLLNTQGDYRDRGLDTQQLAEVVEDARLSPERRVAAALALAPVADSDVQRRLRIATDSSAHEPLRIALDSALAGELELQALEEANATYEASAS